MGRIGKNREENVLDVQLNDSRMEEVDCYRYLGVDISSNSRMNEEVSHRIGEARKASGALQRLWKNRRMSVQAKVGMYKGIAEPSLLYACETWVTNVCERIDQGMLRWFEHVERTGEEQLVRKCMNPMSGE